LPNDDEKLTALTLAMDAAPAVEYRRCDKYCGCCGKVNPSGADLHLYYHIRGKKCGPATKDFLAFVAAFSKLVDPDDAETFFARVLPPAEAAEAIEEWAKPLAREGCIMCGARDSIGHQFRFGQTCVIKHAVLAAYGAFRGYAIAADLRRGAAMTVRVAPTPAKKRSLLDASFVSSDAQESAAADVRAALDRLGVRDTLRAVFMEDVEACETHFATTLARALDTVAHNLDSLTETLVAGGDDESHVMACPALLLSPASQVSTVVV